MGVFLLNFWHYCGFVAKPRNPEIAEELYEEVLKQWEMGARRKARFFRTYFSWKEILIFFIIMEPMIVNLFLIGWFFVFCLMKLSWSKTLVRKWFNIKSKTEEFQADEVVCGGGCPCYWLLFFAFEWVRFIYEIGFWE